MLTGKIFTIVLLISMSLLCATTGVFSEQKLQRISPSRTIDLPHDIDYICETENGKIVALSLLSDHIHIYKINLHDGKILWDREFVMKRLYDIRLVVMLKYIVFAGAEKIGSTDITTYGFDAQCGDMLWSKQHTNIDFHRIMSSNLCYYYSISSDAVPLYLFLPSSILRLDYIDLKTGEIIKGQVLPSPCEGRCKVVFVEWHDNIAYLGLYSDIEPEQGEDPPSLYIVKCSLFEVQWMKQTGYKAGLAGYVEPKCIYYYINIRSYIFKTYIALMQNHNVEVYCLGSGENVVIQNVEYIFMQSIHIDKNRMLCRDSDSYVYYDLETYEIIECGANRPVFGDKTIYAHGWLWIIQWNMIFRFTLT